VLPKKKSVAFLHTINNPRKEIKKTIPGTVYTAVISALWGGRGRRVEFEASRATE
jgi:hypothetical protein